MSELDNIIAPEIHHDEFALLLTTLIAEEQVDTVLEIGASSGEGSTEAIYRGLKQSRRPVHVYSIEVSATRFEALHRRYAHEHRMHSFNVSSVRIDEFPSSEQVAAFYQGHKTNLNQYPLERVLGWLKQDVDYIRQHAVSEGGIDIIKKQTSIEIFDLVLIDGSEFSGVAELKAVHGAKFVLLDDTTTYKNYQNDHQLKEDSLYELVVANPALRNGYAVYKRKDAVSSGRDYASMAAKFRTQSSSKANNRGFWRRLWPSG